ncbi:MAG: N-acyl homoserine lactonase family protein [Thermodesulfobacteriota bacterium]
MKEYTLELFTNAMGPAREKSRFTYLNFYGDKVDIPYIVWRIAGADQNVLIDCGCSSLSYYTVIKGGSAAGFRAGGETFKDVVDVTSFEDGLAAWGLKPEDVDMIILTHLHWDHIMNAEKCKNAKIVVQEEEWRTALAPSPMMQFAYAPRWYYESMRNLELVKNDLEIIPGVRLILSPGHTPGGQSVAVNTKDGWYCVSGYCAINHNLYPPEEIKKALGYPVIPATVHTDALAAYQSTLKLLQMFGDKVLPSHEQELMKVKKIPK